MISSIRSAKWRIGSRCRFKSWQASPQFAQSLRWQDTTECQTSNLLPACIQKKVRSGWLHTLCISIVLAVKLCAATGQYCSRLSWQEQHDGKVPLVRSMPWQLPTGKSETLKRLHSCISFTRPGKEVLNTQLHCRHLHRSDLLAWLWIRLHNSY